MAKKLNKLGVENSLWNNIRAKKGSGKKPTKEMLKQEAKIKNEEKMKKSYKKGGSSFLEESKEVSFGYPPMPASPEKKKKGGAKSMEPGGGGRFAKMVSKLKGKGKSEESAKAIAASIGRKKYGKSKFQEMAAKGRSKKEEGGFEDDEMESTMESTTNPPKRRKKVNASAAARKRGAKARKNQKRGRTGCWSGNCMDEVEGLD